MQELEEKISGEKTGKSKCRRKNNAKIISNKM
jgi:hypothetical protein